jgi:hypothetical protein
MAAPMQRTLFSWNMIVALLSRLPWIPEISGGKRGQLSAAHGRNYCKVDYMNDYAAMQGYLLTIKGK